MPAAVKNYSKKQFSALGSFKKRKWGVLESILNAHTLSYWQSALGHWLRVKVLRAFQAVTAESWMKQKGVVCHTAGCSLSPTAASGTRTFPANLDELSVCLTSASALLWIASHALYYCCHICFDRGGWPDGQRNLWPAPNCRGVRWELAPRAAHIVSEHQTHTQHITNAKYCRVGGMSICCTYTHLKPNCPDNEHS